MEFKFLKLALILLSFSITFGCQPKQSQRQTASQSSDPQIRYNDCVLNAYLAKNPKIKNCNFSEMRVGMGKILRDCNMQAISSTQSEVSTLSTKINQWRESALLELNITVNNYIKECNCVGSAQYTLNSGRVQVNCNEVQGLQNQNEAGVE